MSCTLYQTEAEAMQMLTDTLKPIDDSVKIIIEQGSPINNTPLMLTSFAIITTTQKRRAILDEMLKMQKQDNERFYLAGYKLEQDKNKIQAYYIRADIKTKG